jgi:DNA-binding NarL/FixJ family response regulator
VKILVVDNQTLFREGLQYLLRAIGPSVEVLQARSLREGQVLLEQHRDLTLVLMEIALPDAARFQGLAAWRRLRRNLPIVILTAAGSTTDVERARQLGASGFVPKSSSSGELVSAIRRVLTGAPAFPAPVASMNEGARPQVGGAIALTPRQHDVLVALAQGQSNKEIAEHLDLSPNTVRIHLAAVYRALGVESRVAAVVRGQELGLVDRAGGGGGEEDPAEERTREG